MRLLRIGLDIDDTVFDYAGNLLKFFKEKTGIEIKFEDFKHYDLTKFSNLDHTQAQKVFDDFHAIGGVYMLPPFTDAIENIPRIKNKADFEVSTAREERYTSFTLGELNVYYGIVPTEYHLCKKEKDSWRNIPDNKVRIALERKFDLMIDDSYSNSIALANAGIKVLVPAKPWNVNLEHENITRGTWREICVYIERIELK